MRELVYLSQRKLQMFVSGDSKRWLSRVRLDGNLGIPGLGNIKVARESSPDDPPILDRVIANLERSERASQWYEDDGVYPGQWISFEAPLNYRVMNEKRFRGMLVFIDLPDRSSSRLLLHGSSSNLLGTPPNEVNPDLRRHEIVTHSDRIVFPCPFREGDEIELGETVEALSSAHDSSFTTDPEVEAVPPPDVSFRSIRDLVLSLDKCLQSNTAAWMAGISSGYELNSHTRAALSIRQGSCRDSSIR